MAIKRLVFSSLTATGFTYTALGGVRFYDPAGVLIGSGALITGGRTSAEFANFTVTATDTYNSAYYDIGNAYDQAKPQTGKYTDYWYWLSSLDNQTHEVTFGTAVAGIGKVEFVPTPDTSPQNERGIDAAFKAAAYDEAGVLIHEYTVTPSTSSRNLLNTLLTPEWEATGGGTATTQFQAARASLEVVTAPAQRVQTSRLSVEVLTAIVPTVASLQALDGAVGASGAVSSRLRYAGSTAGSLGLGGELSTQLRSLRSLEGSLAPAGALAPLYEANLGLMASRASLEVLTQPLTRVQASRLSVEFLIASREPLIFSSDLAGGLGFSGEVVTRRVERARPHADLTFESSLGTSSFVVREGEVGFIGGLDLQSSSGVVQLGSSVGFGSKLGLLVQRPLTASLTFASALGVDEERISIDAGLSFAREISFRNRIPGLIGDLLLAGDLIARPLERISLDSSLGWSGQVEGWRDIGALGDLGFAGHLAIRRPFSVLHFEGGLSFDGVGGVGRWMDLGTATLDFSGKLLFHTVDLAGGISPLGELGIRTRARFNGDLSFGIWVTRPMTFKVSYHLPQNLLTFNSTLGRGGNIPLSGADFVGAIGFVGNLGYLPKIRLDGELNPSSGLDVIRVLESNLDFSGSVRAIPLIDLVGALDLIGDLERLPKIRLDGELAPSPEVGFLIARALDGVLGFSGDVQRRIALSLLADLDINGDARPLSWNDVQIIRILHEASDVPLLIHMGEIV